MNKEEFLNFLLENEYWGNDLDNTIECLDDHIKAVKSGYKDGCYVDFLQMSIEDLEYCILALKKTKNSKTSLISFCPQCEAKLLSRNQLYCHRCGIKLYNDEKH